MRNGAAYDAVVVGLGAMGAATLAQLARRGLRVLGIDRYAPPHTRGSTHGESRITRQAIGEGLQFVPLALRSQVLWREIEAESGTQLFNACGGIVIARAGVASAMHGQRDFLGTTFAAARRFGIAHEALTASEVQRRFPQFALRGDELAYYEPGAGALNPEACVAAQLALAQARGAQVITGARVHAVTQHGEAVHVESEGGVFEAGQAVVTAGAWLPALVPALAPRLKVSRQVITWFAHDGSQRYVPAHMPVFIWQWGRGEEEVFYGFPQMDAQPHIKVAAESFNVIAAPDMAAREVADDEVAATYESHVRTRLRGVVRDCTRAATCLYTHSPDSNFIIDRMPDAPNIVAVSACSGHGFKHSAAIGEAVAQWVAGGDRPAVLAPFAA